MLAVSASGQHWFVVAACVNSDKLTPKRSREAVMASVTASEKLPTTTETPREINSEFVILDTLT
jgi:hypothetical protein